MFWRVSKGFVRLSWFSLVGCLLRCFPSLSQVNPGDTLFKPRVCLPCPGTGEATSHSKNGKSDDIEFVFRFPTTAQMEKESCRIYIVWRDVFW